MLGSIPAKAASFAEDGNLVMSPISLNMVAPNVKPMPGMVVRYVLNWEKIVAIFSSMISICFSVYCICFLATAYGSILTAVRYGVRSCVGFDKPTRRRTRSAIPWR